CHLPSDAARYPISNAIPGLARLERLEKLEEVKKIRHPTAEQNVDTPDTVKRAERQEIIQRHNDRRDYKHFGPAPLYPDSPCEPGGRDPLLTEGPGGEDQTHRESR